LPAWARRFVRGRPRRTVLLQVARQTRTGPRLRPCAPCWSPTRAATWRRGRSDLPPAVFVQSGLPGKPSPPRDSCRRTRARSVPAGARSPARAARSLPSATLPCTAPYRHRRPSSARRQRTPRSRLRRTGCGVVVRRDETAPRTDCHMDWHLDWHPDWHPDSSTASSSTGRTCKVNLETTAEHTPSCVRRRAAQCPRQSLSCTPAAPQVAQPAQRLVLGLVLGQGQVLRQGQGQWQVQGQGQ
jgi:hypothetical protein